MPRRFFRRGVNVFLQAGPSTAMIKQRLQAEQRLVSEACERIARQMRIVAQCERASSPHAAEERALLQFFEQVARHHQATITDLQERLRALAPARPLPNNQRKGQLGPETRASGNR